MEHRRKRFLGDDVGANADRVSRRSPDHDSDRNGNRGGWNRDRRSPQFRRRPQRSRSRSGSDCRRYQRRKSPSSISDDDDTRSSGYGRGSSGRRRRFVSRSRSRERRSLSARRDDDIDNEDYRDDKGRRRRRNDNHDETARIIDRHLERPIKVVAIRNIPLDMTENAIELAVRDAAISLGFSVPNLVRILSTPQNRTAVTSGTKTSLPADREPNTTSAFVDFPSVEAAQVFVDACRRNFVIQNAKVSLEMARPYVGGLSTMTTPDTKLEWVCCVCQEISRPGTPQCLRCRTPRLLDSPTVAPSQYTEQLGPNLPFPSMDHFVMDRKSGMFYNEAAGLYFDPQTQQFISLSGVYYMKGANPNAVLVPVSRMDAPGLQVQKSNQQLPPDFNLPWVDKPPGENDQLLSSDSGAPEVVVDASQSKASAVASVLAAAQYAAKQTKKTKTKTTLVTADVEGAESAVGFVPDAKHRATTEQGGTTAPAQVLNVQSMFDDTAVEEEEKRPNAPKESAVAVASTTQDSLVAAPGEIATGEYICFLCLRQFNTGQQLAAHELNSQLHKRNAELQCLAVA